MKVTNATFFKSLNLAITSGVSLLFCYTAAIALFVNDATIKLNFNAYGEGFAELFFFLPLTLAAAVWTFLYSIQIIRKEIKQGRNYTEKYMYCMLCGEGSNITIDEDKKGRKCEEVYVCGKCKPKNIRKAVL